MTEKAIYAQNANMKRVHFAEELEESFVVLQKPGRPLKSSLKQSSNIATIRTQVAENKQAKERIIVNDFEIVDKDIDPLSGTVQTENRAEDLEDVPSDESGDFTWLSAFSEEGRDALKTDIAQQEMQFSTFMKCWQTLNDIFIPISIDNRELNRADDNYDEILSAAYDLETKCDIQENQRRFDMVQSNFYSPEAVISKGLLAGSNIFWNITKSTSFPTKVTKHFLLIRIKEMVPEALSQKKLLEIDSIDWLVIFLALLLQNKTIWDLFDEKEQLKRQLIAAVVMHVKTSRKQDISAREIEVLADLVPVSN